MRISAVLSVAALCSLLSAQVHADSLYGLKPGSPPIQSASSISFGPDGILFVGDAKGAAVYALETKDSRSKTPLPESIEGIDRKIAGLLNVAPKEVKITDLTVNPETKNVFLSAQIGNDAPRIFKVDGSEKGLSELSLKEINFSVANLPNPAEDKEVVSGNRKRNNRASAITDLTFFNGQLLVAGLSNDKAASNVWSMMFPFQEVDQGTPLEIFHGAHGRSEDYAPIRTFVPFVVNGEPNLLAGYVCTPLVKFPLSKLTAEKKEKVTGTTLAELGNRNQPLDMIAYKKDNRDYLLLSNSARGVMKISTEDLGRQNGITEPVRDGNVAGQAFEQIPSLEGTSQLDKLDDTRAVVVIQKENGPATLKVVQLP